AMKEFTDKRGPDTLDELWIVEHDPVYTVGLNIRKQHFPEPNTNIPVVETDRGGDITYHGPGQLIIYLLLNLRRRNLGIRQLVNNIEQSIIDCLEQNNITATRKKDAPGVYVNEKKIAALGLRIRKGCSYHGLSFNLDMDTKPFSKIPPCGYKNLEVTQLSDFLNEVNKTTVTNDLIRQLQLRLGYNTHHNDPLN
ncbi:MAG: lipoyl(octanoyl) transferase LipB, partial [Acidiferrobacterales bacterium]